MRSGTATRVLAYAAALLCVCALATGCGRSGAGLKVGLAYGIGGPGDHGFNDEALAGLDRAKKDLPGKVASVRALTARADETAADQYARLTLLCHAGYNPVIAVGYTYAGSDPASGPLARAAKECPDTKFAIIDNDTVTQPNVANLVFADEQGAYLMGIVAARTSTTGTIGLLGGCPIPLIDRFLAGYRAGAEAVRPDVVVDVAYVSTDPAHCDFTDVAAGRAAATGLYDGGADVVFQVAGGAGVGVFDAADSLGKLAIGVDADQFETVAQPLRHVILTSMLKRVDTAVYDFIRQVAEGGFTAGTRRYDLADDGVGYATSGGFITDLVPTLQEYRRRIVAGKIVVPVTP